MSNYIPTIPYLLQDATFGEKENRLWLLQGLKDLEKGIQRAISEVEKGCSPYSLESGGLHQGLTNTLLYSLAWKRHSLAKDCYAKMLQSGNNLATPKP